MVKLWMLKVYFILTMQLQSKDTKNLFDICTNTYHQRRFKSFIVLQASQLALSRTIHPSWTAEASTSCSVYSTWEKTRILNHTQLNQPPQPVQIASSKPFIIKTHHQSSHHDYYEFHNSSHIRTLYSTVILKRYLFQDTHNPTQIQ